MNKVDFTIMLLLFNVYTGISGCKQANGKSSLVTAENKTGTLASKEVLFHYWDKYDFKNTVALKKPELGQQALVDFIFGFSKVSDTIRSNAVKQMLSKAQRYPSSFRFFVQQFEKYLYDPNSPMRNDLYYKPVVEFLLDSCLLDDDDEYKYNVLLKLIKKNQIGSKAPNFKFQLPEGNESTLYSVTVPFTLLFFYEPGCPHCEATIDNFQNTPEFLHLVKMGKLNVLAIYALGGSNIWKAYQSHIPAPWMNGLDNNMQILSKELYEIRATPTIYLLDKDKTVLLKDTDLSKVAVFFKDRT